MLLQPVSPNLSKLLQKISSRGFYSIWSVSNNPISDTKIGLVIAGRQYSTPIISRRRGLMFSVHSLLAIRHDTMAEGHSQLEATHIIVIWKQRENRGATEGDIAFRTCLQWLPPPISSHLPKHTWPLNSQVNESTNVAAPSSSGHLHKTFFWVQSF